MDDGWTDGRMDEGTNGRINIKIINCERSPESTIPELNHRKYMSKHLLHHSDGVETQQAR